MNTKLLCALACACASLSANAFTLDVTYSQNEWLFNLVIGTDIAPAVPGTWSIDGTPIGYGASRPFAPFTSGTPLLRADFASIWYLTPDVEHTVAFAADDGSGLVLGGDEPYIIHTPTTERPLVNPVPESFGGAWLGVALLGMVGVKRVFH